MSLQNHPVLAAIEHLTETIARLEHEIQELRREVSEMREESEWETESSVSQNSAPATFSYEE